MQATRCLLAASRRKASTIALPASNLSKSFFMATVPLKKGLPDDALTAGKLKKDKMRALEGLEDGNEVLASFFSTSSSKTRRSPLLQSLLAQSTTPASANDSAYFLLRGESATEAMSSFRRRVHHSTSAAIFNIEEGSVQSVTVDHGVWSHAPVSSNGPLFVQAAPVEIRIDHEVKNEGPLYGK